MNTYFDAYSGRRRPGRGLRPFLFMVLLLLAVSLAVSLAVAFLRRGVEADIRFDSALHAVGQGTRVAVTADSDARGLAHLRVQAVQGDQRLALAEVDLDSVPWWALWRRGTESHTVEVEIGRAVWPALQAGEVTIWAEAASAGSPLGGGKTVSRELVLPVRLVPPAIESLSDADVVRQGGAGVVAYVVGDSSVRDGVRVGVHFFPGVDLHGSQLERVRFAFFAVSHDLEDPAEIRLTAVDELGNAIERPFLQRFDRRRFKTDDIHVTDSFLEDVVPEILSLTPEVRPSGVLVDDYVVINRDLRRKNQARLLELGSRSRDEMLWHGAFLQLPSSRVMAGFGEDRTYFYEGRVIDRQTHLGYDLASERRAVVPAAADGVVVLAEFFGIYGKTVLLDHGFGVMTLYSHLSQWGVAAGDTVARGDALGRTGTTGLAGGDHLHFAVLVRGVQVDPLEWLDSKWLDSRITAKLKTKSAV